MCLRYSVSYHIFGCMKCIHKVLQWDLFFVRTRNQGITFLPLEKNVDELEKDERKVPGLFCCSWTWGAQYMCFQRFPVLTFNPHRKGRRFLLTHHGSYVYAFLLIPGILFVFLLGLYLLHTFLLLGFPPTEIKNIIVKLEHWGIFRDLYVWYQKFVCSANFATE